MQQNIKKYSELKLNDWWNMDIELEALLFGRQRYLKEKIDKSFDISKIEFDVPLLPYYKIGNEIYKMILCPSGSFWRGHKDQENNKPEEMKIKKSFLLGETEITQEVYESVMGENPSRFKGKPRNPVEMVSWYDALIFCNRLSDIFGLDRYYTFGDAQKIRPWGYWDENKPEPIYYPIKMNENSKGFRLPTEWEWEYAAKAGTQLKYSGSNDPKEMAWYVKNSNGTTHPVKQKIANAWGFYDMSGNVAEWCEDTWNPLGFGNYDISTPRMYRGGGWNQEPTYLCSTFRAGQSAPNLPHESIGFRICRYI